MARTWSFLLILFLVFAKPALFAQEETPPEEEPAVPAPGIESEWEDYFTTTYARGDMTFTITLGVLFPTYFSGLGENDNGLDLLGGAGSLSFSYFFTPHFFFGGELGGSFTGTRYGNMLYVVPIGLKAGFQFVYKRLEFPLSLMVGGAPQKYLEQSYFGLIVRPGASVFWRFSPDWSFGLNTVWWFVPQWPKDGNTVYGNFTEVTLSARYHF